MSIHGDDVVIQIRKGLIAAHLAPSMTDVRHEPNPEQGWPNRDGTLQFDCVGRDCMRGFRVTVEVVDLDEVWGGVTDARDDGHFDFWDDPVRPTR